MKYIATFYREFTAEIEAPDLEAARAKARQIVAADGLDLRLASVIGAPPAAEMTALSQDGLKLPQK